MKKITHAGVLKIGDAEIPCFVAEDGTRLLARRQLQVATRVVDAKKSQQVSGKTRFDRFLTQLVRISDALGDQSLINDTNGKSFLEPEAYQYGKRKIIGHDARLLQRICRIMLKGRKKGLLTSERQQIIAEQCEVLQEGFSEVGLLALVDEATGYQDVRGEQALQRILDAYLQDYAKKWTKTFPDVFWKKLFKAKGYDNVNFMKRPSYVGHWVNDIIYDRLAPGIRKKLKELNPKIKGGSRKHKNHQFFNEDYGSPELREHLAKTMTLMDASANPTQFDRLLNRSLPKFGDTIEMTFENDE